MNKNKNILEVRDVNKTFRNGKYSVYASQEVTFDVPKGKLIGLIGESGSGKTTIGRTILNLLYPDSGSIKINNTEIGERKLSKKQKKDLYRNIQMIFQDPYSSLNSQKNIMKIVSESLIAKGIDKEIFNNFYKNRKKILFFSKYTLRNFLYEQQYNYLLFQNTSKIKSLNKIINKIETFKLSDKETITKNFVDITTEIYNIKEDYTYNAISKINDLINSLYDFWLKEKNNIMSENYSSQDEKDLDEITEKYKNVRKEIKESLETQNIKNKLKNKYDEYKELVTEKKYFISTVKKQYKTNIRNIKSKAYSLILDKLESKNIKQYANFKKLYKKEITIIKVIKRIKRKKVYIDFNKIIDFLKKNELKMILKNYKKHPKSHFKNKIDKIADDLKIKNPLTFNIDILKLKKQINNLNKKLSISIQKDKKRELIKLKKQAINIKEEKNRFKKIFKDELNKYILDSEREIKNKINKLKKENKSLILKLENLQKICLKKEKNIIKKILSLKNYDKKAFRNISKEKKYIKAKYLDMIKKDKTLNIEIKENQKILKSLKFLYGIIKFSFKIFEKKKLKDILVREEVFKTLEKVGLNRGVAYRYPHEFSGGMRQRVSIARAIISKPNLIIADEPIAALDVSIQAQIVNLLMDLKKSENLSMLFIAHDLSMIEHNSDEVIIMHLGRIVEKGKTEIVFKNPIHPYTKTLMEAIPTISKMNQKFEDKKFIPEYLKGYGFEKKPEIHQISKDHFVFGTSRQIKKWK